MASPFVSDWLGLAHGSDVAAVSGHIAGRTTRRPAPAPLPLFGDRPPSELVPCRPERRPPLPLPPARQPAVCFLELAEGIEGLIAVRWARAVRMMKDLHCLAGGHALSLSP